MAKFINTKKTVAEIENLIKSAGEKLILISPYLKLSNDYKELLQYRNSKDKVTTIIFGKQELNPDEMRFLQSLRLLVLKYNENLHAKCYMNDDKMIITSLNLYEFSMINNKEMGVLIEKKDPADTQLFEEAFAEIDFISHTSQRFEIAPSKTTESKFRSESYSRNSPKHTEGYCIRTGVPITFNVEKPLSYEAFKKWNEYGDPEYPEKFCHFSGDPSNGETSVSRPILKKHWKKAKEVFSL